MLLKGGACLLAPRLVLVSRHSAARRVRRASLLSTRAGDASGEMAGEEPVRDRVGFGRSEMFSEPLYGTVKPYDTHVFLCHGTAAAWSGKLEGVEGLPKMYMDAFDAAKDRLKGAGAGKVKVTVYEAAAGDADGDVLLYPHMLRLPGVGAERLPALVDALASADAAAALAAVVAAPARISDPAVFVCAHARRDKRCGVCGPALMTRFQQELQTRALAATVPVRACSHIGGHAYAGNVIVFTPRAGDGVRGDWFGYVAPDDVPAIIDRHMKDGEDLPRLWRGRMGMSPEEHTSLAKAALAACGDAAACGDCDKACEPGAAAPRGLLGTLAAAARGAVSAITGSSGSSAPAPAH